MVYSRFLELPRLGSGTDGLLHRTAALSNPLDPVTASLEAKWLGVSEMVMNATAEAKRAGVTTPHPYAENSICFVEPLVSRRVRRARRGRYVRRRPLSALPIAVRFSLFPTRRVTPGGVEPSFTSRKPPNRTRVTRKTTPEFFSALADRSMFRDPRPR